MVYTVKNFIIALVKALTKDRKTAHEHISDNQTIKYILRRTKNGEYFPLTGYRCAICGEEFSGDGIWWILQGIPLNVIFDPEPPVGDKIIVDCGFVKFKAGKIQRV